jgi:hypothetical protein
MMNVIVNGETRTLTLVDENGADWIKDFIGNWSALNQFPTNEEGDYTADEETFAWWAKAVERQRQNEARKIELEEIHGRAYVCHALSDCGSDDLEDYQNQVADALANIQKKYELFRFADTPVGGEFMYCTESELEAAKAKFNPHSWKEISDERYKNEVELDEKRGFYLATGHWI